MSDQITKPLKAIKAYCVSCAGGPIKAGKCAMDECPLHPFRKGKNPFSKRKGNPNIGLVHKKSRDDDFESLMYAQED